jgi:hypothetical protein
MAEAKTVEFEQTVTKLFQGIQLTLTAEEALVLYVVLHRVGGAPKGYRGDAENILDSLTDSLPELNWGSLDYDRMKDKLDGHLRFDDVK